MPIPRDFQMGKFRSCKLVVIKITLRKQPALPYADAPPMANQRHQKKNDIKIKIILSFSHNVTVAKFISNWLLLAHTTS
jgi:hypothetical protein